ncbi:hypothetical protein WR25_04724 [Diploscapter pachys]|uniref:ZP domain-containing protein n=1 Tax=Diploscapter pachys TaxID=2018661 RepID=A0A2A2L5Z8_9BILA|nr:hypothetical protein WR25_04724 [Diploscapter pachys]
MINIYVHTDGQFKGNIYAKGFFHKPECRNANKDSNGNVSIGLSIAGECGIRRKRMANPRGMQLDTTLVLMEHPVFLTQGDRAYHIQCKYLEEETVVTHSIHVSAKSPTEIPSIDSRLPLPTCNYQVLKSNEKGELLQYATIGDVVYHKWSCTSQTKNKFCMTVHSCSVDDGQGNGQLIINEQGCSLDTYILDNLQYIDDLTVGQKSHVFKFADKETVFFSCMIRLQLKESMNDTCPVPTEQCKEMIFTGTVSINTPNRVEGDEMEDFPRPERSDEDILEALSREYGDLESEQSFLTHGKYNVDRESPNRSPRSVDFDISAQPLQVIDAPEIQTFNDHPIAIDYYERARNEMCFSNVTVFFYFSLLTLLLFISTLLLYIIQNRIKSHPRPVPWQVHSDPPSFFSCSYAASYSSSCPF